MNASELLENLAQQGVRISANNEKLNIRSPKGALTPELRAELAARKAEIIALLNRNKNLPAISLEEELTPRKIARLLQGDVEPSFSQGKEFTTNPREMARHLTVTFRPLPDGYKNENVLKFREDLEVNLREYGVEVRPWYRATKEISTEMEIPLAPWKKLAKKRIVKADVRAVIEVEKIHLCKKFDRARNGISNYLEDSDSTLAITLKGAKSNPDSTPLPYREKAKLGLRTLARSLSKLVLEVSKEEVSLLTPHYFDSVFSKSDIDDFVLNSIIPKIFIRKSRSIFHQLDSGQDESPPVNFVEKLAPLEKELKATGLLPPRLQLRESGNWKSPISFGSLIYAENPQYIGKPEITEYEWENLVPVEGFGADKIRQNAQGRWYLKTRINAEDKFKQIPDIWLINSYSDRNPIRISWQAGRGIQIPQTVQPEIANSLTFDELYDIIAIALSVALHAPQLIKQGMPIVRFPGYPTPEWFQPHEYCLGAENFAITPGSWESSILKFLDISRLANHSGEAIALVSLIDRDRGTTVFASDVDYLVARLKAGWEEGQIALGNGNFAPLRAVKEPQRELQPDNGRADDSWLVLPPANEQVKLRLFCFHASGCGASMYRTWAEYLPPTIAVCPIQLPGRETRLEEPLFTQLSALARELAQALLPYLDLPFACFGHSMGALTSFEVVRQLRRLKAPKPVHLFVSSHRAPQIPLPSQPTHQFSDEIFIETLHHRFGSFPEETRQNTMLMRYALPMLRADLQMCETYTFVPEAPLDCPISAFGGLQDCTVTPHELRTWGEQTSQGCRLQMFPGGHFYFSEDPAPLLHAIAQELLPILAPVTLSNSRNLSEG
jgi:surfactin synthase thioesterase subunit